MVLCWVAGSAATEALVCGQVGAAFDPRLGFFLVAASLH